MPRPSSSLWKQNAARSSPCREEQRLWQPPSLSFLKTKISFQFEMPDYERPRFSLELKVRELCGDFHCGHEFYWTPFTGTRQGTWGSPRGLSRIIVYWKEMNVIHFSFSSEQEMMPLSSVVPQSRSWTLCLLFSENITYSSVLFLITLIYSST